MHGETVK